MKAPRASPARAKPVHHPAPARHRIPANSSTGTWPSFGSGFSLKLYGMGFCKRRGEGKLLDRPDINLVIHPFRLPPEGYSCTKTVVGVRVRPGIGPPHWDYAL
jgi:hypothetical protein